MINLENLMPIVSSARKELKEQLLCKDFRHRFSNLKISPIEFSFKSNINIHKVRSWVWGTSVPSQSAMDWLEIFESLSTD